MTTVGNVDLPSPGAVACAAAGGPAGAACPAAGAAAAAGLASCALAVWHETTTALASATSVRLDMTLIIPQGIFPTHPMSGCADRLIDGSGERGRAAPLRADALQLREALIGLEVVGKAERQ